MFAIAAMSRNRVIGKGGGIPWRIPEEHRWFRRTTMNGVVIMGRRTFESLPGPLDGRVNVVLTRDPARFLEEEQRRGRLRGAVVGGAAQGASDLVQLTLPGSGAEVRLARSLDALARAGQLREPAWLCGGAQVYEELLPDCAELFLSVVDREVEGDAFFPRFEHLFDLDTTVHEAAEFRVLHYRRNAVDRRAPP
jgi:dihydrofolate reductase